MDKDELAQQRMNDWLAGPGGTTAAVITGIIVVALLWTIISGFFS